MTIPTSARRPGVAELATGVRLPYVEQGRPDGVPVLLLHGYSDSWTSFDGVLSHLPEELRAIAVTQRGHGDAERPESGYAMADLAADAVALLDALGIDTAVVVGHSMGGLVAQQLAIGHPGRARGLVLVGSFPALAGRPVMVELAEAVATLEDPVDPAFVEEFQRSTVAGEVSPSFLEGVVGESLKLPARVWQAVAAGLSAVDHRDQLGRITAPTLLLWGDHDAMAGRSEQEVLAAGIPGARLVAYEGVGHAVHWEQPERVAGDIAAFALGLGPKG